MATDGTCVAVVVVVVVVVFLSKVAHTQPRNSLPAKLCPALIVALIHMLMHSPPGISQDGAASPASHLRPRVSAAVGRQFAEGPEHRRRDQNAASGASSPGLACKSASSESSDAMSKRENSSAVPIEKC